MNDKLLFARYVAARHQVIAAGYGDEVDWQSQVDFSACTETDFLREGCWVIVSSGMKELVVRRSFSAIEQAFFRFQSSRAIVDQRDVCLGKALSAFDHERKMMAVLSLATRVAVDGFRRVREGLKQYGVDYLQTFDFLGPATAYHLAKNLGLDVAKPDRHLLRASKAAGFESVDRFCRTLANWTGDTVPVVDLVVWRFATIFPDYENWWALEDGERATHPSS